MKNDRSLFSLSPFMPQTLRRIKSPVSRKGKRKWRKSENDNSSRCFGLFKAWLGSARRDWLRLRVKKSFLSVGDSPVYFAKTSSGCLGISWRQRINIISRSVQTWKGSSAGHVPDRGCYLYDGGLNVSVLKGGFPRLLWWDFLRDEQTLD